MSSPPQAAAAAAIAPSIWSSTVQSAGRTRHSPPAARIVRRDLLEARPAAGDRATRAPSAAKRRAVALPMPLLAPVTTARRPANRSGMGVMTGLSARSADQG